MRPMPLFSRENDMLLVKSLLYNSQSSIDNPFSLFFLSVTIAPFEFTYLPLAAIATVSTNILKDFKPTVFDSLKNGHSCNTTFLFSILNHVGLLKDGINGSGTKGHPFYVTIQ